MDMVKDVTCSLRRGYARKVWMSNNRKVKRAFINFMLQFEGPSFILILSIIFKVSHKHTIYFCKFITSLYAVCT